MRIVADGFLNASQVILVIFEEYHGSYQHEKTLSLDGCGLLMVLKIVYLLDRASRMKISLTHGHFPLLFFFSALHHALLVLLNIVIEKKIK